MGSKWPPLAMEARGPNSSTGAHERLPGFLQVLPRNGRLGAPSGSPSSWHQPFTPSQRGTACKCGIQGLEGSLPSGIAVRSLVYLEKSGCGCSLFPTKCELHPHMEM